MARKVTAVQKADFSKTAIQRAVLKCAAAHPATIWPAAAGIGGVFVAVLFASSVALTAGVGCIIISGGSFLINTFVRGEKTAGKFIQDQRALMESQQVAELDDLQNDLVEHQDKPIAKECARRALQQFKQLRTTMQNIRDLLGRKIEEHEMAYWRISAAAENLFSQVFKNLRVLENILLDVESVDLDYAKNQLTVLKRKAKQSAGDEKSVTAITARLDSVQAQLDLADEILGNNEVCLTEMEHTTTQISRMNSQNDSDIEAAINELQRLAAVVATFGNQSKSSNTLSV